MLVVMTRNAYALVAVILVVVVLPFSNARGGYYTNATQLAKVASVEVVVEDRVSDLCLPRPASLQNEAENILRRMGILVAMGAKYSLQISPAGFEMQGEKGQPSGYCAASLEISLWSVEKLQDGSAAIVPAANTVSTHVGAKDAFQNQLRKAVNYVVTTIANEILKARTSDSSQPQ